MAETKIQVMHEDVQIPFENDEKIIGKWKIIGEYNNRTEFDLGQTRQEESIGNRNGEVFFLPKGEWYWCYSWTKGKLLVDNGDSSYVNDYTTEKRSDGLYMFVNLKSYAYLQTGRTTLLVLRQRTLPARTISPFPFVTTRASRENGNLWPSSWIRMILIQKTSPAVRICILKRLNFCQTVNASVFMETKP